MCNLLSDVSEKSLRTEIKTGSKMDKTSVKITFGGSRSRICDYVFVLFLQLS